MTENKNMIKLNVQKRIVFFSVLLLFGKLLAYQLTNSVGILTDALESIVNVAAGLISLYSISIAIKPKDANHPFGHGKVELISASVEGLLISIAGLVIIYEAIYRLFVPSEINQLDIGIVIVAIAGLINYILGAWSIRTGEKYQSIALIAGGKHLQSDTYSTIGLVLGLIILYFTNLVWLDSLIAIIFGTVLIFTGYKILRTTTSNLMDEADFAILEKLVDVINSKRSPNWVHICNVKIIKYGNAHHIDCDLTLPWFFNIIESKEESKKLKAILNEQFQEEIDLAIHTNPCNESFCKQCMKFDCSARQFEFEKEIIWNKDSFSLIE